MFHILWNERGNLGGNQLRIRVDRAIRGGGVCACLCEQPLTRKRVEKEKRSIYTKNKMALPNPIPSDRIFFLI